MYLCYALASLDNVYLVWFVRSWLALIYSLLGGFNFLELARDGFVILKHISGNRGHEEEIGDDETQKNYPLRGSQV